MTRQLRLMSRIRPKLAMGLLTAALAGVTGPVIWTASSGFEHLYATLAIDYELVPEPGSLLLVGTALVLGARCAARAVRRTDGGRG